MSAMAELDAAIRGTSFVRESAAEWVARQRRAINADIPVTITLGFRDADRLATILCRIESGIRVDLDDDDEEDDVTDLAGRLFGTVCAANDAASRAQAVKA